MSYYLSDGTKYNEYEKGRIVEFFVSFCVLSRYAQYFLSKMRNVSIFGVLNEIAFPQILKYDSAIYKLADLIGWEAPDCFDYDVERYKLLNSKLKHPFCHLFDAVSVIPEELDAIIKRETDHMYEILKEYACDDPVDTSTSNNVEHIPEEITNELKEYLGEEEYNRIFKAKD